MVVLVLAPHTDDGELGCGGTIARLVEEGHTLYYLAFSTCEASVPEGFPANALEIEVKLATQHLGILPERLIIKDYPVRCFDNYRQNILEDLVALKKQLTPDIVFMPCSSSIHQDHKVIYEEGLRAFKHTTCYGYDLPWDSNQFTTNGFFILEERHVQRKAEAVAMYKTQGFRAYTGKDFVYGLANVRGAQSGKQYAEAFEVLRSINH